MNLNELAKEITKREKGKVQVNIAQVKEILCVLGEILEEASPDEAMEILHRLINAGKRRMKNKACVTLENRRRG